MDKGMDTGYSIIKKVAFLKVNGKMTREMDLEKKLTKMDLNLKECMWMIWKMEEENINFQMEKFMTENTRMINVMEKGKLLIKTM